MRLVGSFTDEKQAFTFYSFLSSKGIESSYDSHLDPIVGKNVYNIWVLDEERVEEAGNLYDAFVVSPTIAPNVPKNEPPPPPVDLLQEETPNFKVKVHIRPKRPLSHPLNNFLILMCILLYFWNNIQEAKIVKAKGPLAVQIIMTPLQEDLLFDYPASMEYIEQVVKEYPLEGVKDLKDLPQGAQVLIEKSESIPTWKGLFNLLLHFPKGGWDVVREIPLFEKIREGEVWRLITPTFLHRGFLHILFNMAWLWILGVQLEDRLAKWKMLLFILIVAIASNVAQYVMSGPFFLGFSGVVVGMAGFIWMRQRLAPWEGYPLNKPTIIFVLLFVLAMGVLEIVSVILQVLGVTELTPNIANTAHIVGGLTGILLGRLTFFARKEKKP